MLIRLHLRRISWLALLFALSGTGFRVDGQDICVISQKTVRRISGVVSFISEDAVTNRANVKLRSRAGEQQDIFETKTDAEGRFEIPRVPNGKYILIVSRENAVTLFIPVKLRTHASPSKLVITLGATTDEVCGGGEVRLVKERS